MSYIWHGGLKNEKCRDLIKKRCKKYVESICKMNIEVSGPCLGSLKESSSIGEEENHLIDTDFLPMMVCLDAVFKMGNIMAQNIFFFHPFPGFSQTMSASDSTGYNHRLSATSSDAKHQTGLLKLVVITLKYLRFEIEQVCRNLGMCDWLKCRSTDDLFLSHSRNLVARIRIHDPSESRTYLLIPE